SQANQIEVQSSKKGYIGDAKSGYYAVNCIGFQGDEVPNIGTFLLRNAKALSFDVYKHHGSNWLTI
ncbi:MAG: hypothetical protein AAFY56_18485, partial [Pseudomonadota bacterium]